MEHLCCCCVNFKSLQMIVVVSTFDVDWSRLIRSVCHTVVTTDYPSPLSRCWLSTIIPTETFWVYVTYVLHIQLISLWTSPQAKHEFWASDAAASKRRQGDRPISPIYVPHPPQPVERRPYKCPQACKHSLGPLQSRRSQNLQCSTVSSVGCMEGNTEPLQPNRHTHAKTGVRF